MKINKNVLVLAIIFFSFCFGLIMYMTNIPQVKAGSLWDLQPQEAKQQLSAKFGQTADPPDVRTVTVNIIKVFLGLLGIIFLILIIVAGFRWMTAGGNESKVEEAKSQLKNAVIGMIIIFAAFVIVSFVSRRIAQSLSPINGTEYYGPPNCDVDPELCGY